MRLAATPAVPTADDIRARRLAFRRLHEAGCFALPNPWDVGSARLLASLGFRALASTSAGYAWSRGRPDNEVPLPELLQHLRELVAATPLPVNADFGNGYADDAAGVEDHVAQAVATGVAGLSIEDATGDAAQPLYAVDTAVARLAAARRAIDAAGGDTLLVGRAEGLLHGRDDMDDIVRRLQAYAEAGADCLYAPGLRSAEQVRRVVQAVAPRPVNLLVGSAGGFTVAEAAALGVRRVSIGGALARAAWGGVLRAATLLAEEGRFDGFEGGASGAALNALFAEGAGPG